MSNLDKTIRLIVAMLLYFVFGFVCQSWWWLLSLLPLLSAVYGYCPLYKFLKNKFWIPFWESNAIKKFHTKSLLLPSIFQVRPIFSS